MWLSFHLSDADLDQDRFERRVQRMGTLRDALAVLDTDAAHQYGDRFKDVPVFSWLPPARLSSLDDREAGDEEDIGTRASIALWVQQAKRYVWGESQAARVEKQRQTLRDVHLRLDAQRRAELESDPIAVRADGIYIVNWFGTHEAWHRAVDNAYAVLRAKETLENRDFPEFVWPMQIIAPLETRYRKARITAGELRLEGWPVPVYENVHPHAFAEQLVANALFKPGQRLRRFYVFQGRAAAGRAAKITLLDSLYRRFTQLITLLTEEDTVRASAPFLDNDMRLHLIRIVGLHRFFFFEAIAPNVNMEGTRSAHAFAYTAIHHGPSRIKAARNANPDEWPIGIGIVLQHAINQTYVNPTALWIRIIHETGHLLTPNPGADHDVVFYGAMWFLFDLAQRRGLFDTLLSIPENYQQALQMLRASARWPGDSDPAEMAQEHAFRTTTMQVMEGWTQQLEGVRENTLVGTGAPKKRKQRATEDTDDDDYMDEAEEEPSIADL
jgi:hypothetical protein